MNVNRIPPEDCRSIEEIRAEIDALDEHIVMLLGRRFGYVKAASAFKTSGADVRAPERFRTMVQQRRAWAEREGLNPNVIEALYRDLVDYFIDEEMKHWQQAGP